MFHTRLLLSARRHHSVLICDFMVSFEGIPMTQAPLARTASFLHHIFIKKGLAHRV